MNAMQDEIFKIWEWKDKALRTLDFIPLPDRKFFVDYCIDIIEKRIDSFGFFRGAATVECIYINKEKIKKDEEEILLNIVILYTDEIEKKIKKTNDYFGVKLRK